MRLEAWLWEMVQRWYPLDLGAGAQRMDRGLGSRLVMLRAVRASDSRFEFRSGWVWLVKALWCAFAVAAREI